MMRVTESTLVDRMVHDLRNHSERMMRLNDQISSGNRLRWPSDDPAAVTTSMRLRSSLAEVGQYRRNVGAALGWLATTEKALSDATEVLHRARELAVRASSDVILDVTSDAFTSEAAQLLGQLVDVGNASYGGQYVFAGQQTTTRPFDSDGNYLGDGLSITREISHEVSIKVNIPGTALGSPGEPDTALGALATLKQNFENKDSDACSASIAEIDRVLDGILAMRAEVGAKMNRLEVADVRLAELEISLKSHQSKVEGVDLAEALIELRSLETVHRAALATGSRMFQPTLFDFLA